MNSIDDWRVSWRTAYRMFGKFKSQRLLKRPQLFHEIECPSCGANHSISPGTKSTVCQCGQGMEFDYQGKPPLSDSNDWRVWAKTKVKKLLSLAGNTGLLLLTITLLAIFFLIIDLLIIGTANITTRLLPYIFYAGYLCLIIDIAVLLPMAYFKRTQYLAGYGLKASANAFAFLALLFSFIATYQIWDTTGVVVGILLLGLGIIPVAMLATIIHSEWHQLGIIVGVLLFACVKQYVSNRILHPYQFYS